MRYLAGTFLSLALLVSGLSAKAQEAPVVAVSIKPLHSLVSAVMLGVGEPKLIVDGAASAHTYSLKPSNASDIQAARLVFWMGPEMEHFLADPLQSLASNAKVVAMEDVPNLNRLPLREGGAFEADADEAHAETGHDHGAHDMHVWLDPQNAVVMAEAIRDQLVAADPAHQTQYIANTKALEANIRALDTELAATLDPLKDKPFIVFHDAYQYFEKRYGLRVAGSITVSPETAPGAERLSEIHAKIAGLGAACVFAEPQFEPKLLTVVLEGTDARSGTLDPEGATLAVGPELYFQLMRALGTSLRDCLSQK